MESKDYHLYAQLGVQHKLDLLSSIERVFKNYGLIDKNNKILYDTVENFKFNKNKLIIFIGLWCLLSVFSDSAIKCN